MTSKPCHCGLLGFAVLTSLAILSFAEPAAARTLAAIRDRGSISLCAHPNSLPFASRTAEPPGFQVELGQALAQQIGVSLALEWVLIGYQIPRADCDIVLDRIAASDAPTDFGIQISTRIIVVEWVWPSQPAARSHRSTTSTAIPRSRCKPVRLRP